LKNIEDFKKYKSEEKKITMTTCYDFWSARIIDESNIDAVLVGDSVAMVMYGYETTVNASVEMIAQHTKAVRRGLRNKFLISDLPFLAHKRGRSRLVDAVDTIFKAGAEAIKIEGADGILEDIEFLVLSGIPVMGHLGLTPQFVHKFGGFKVQGKERDKAEKIIDDAKRLEYAGISALFLEMIPSNLAKVITETISIPTIGIGAGKYTSGQILVLHDLLGLSKEFKPKFLREYLAGYELVNSALNNYQKDVGHNFFPSAKESY